ncbi:glutamate synthase large subunit [Oceanobacillus halophilus]|uniref:Glutamate synthase large subunit n=1 Tax=Oceanobacillus halophilus TaxID=930130 RepID=A0A495A748_9BACI|nr:glutamate synthase large subunit [Oceanobacillus halophilus]RKQ35630.1 glutamate synthase large subunit [Oceanobacillus halophilus]
MQHTQRIENKGLYEAHLEHDACGIAMLANINGIESHTIVSQALTALERLDHRGGHDAENDVGDGAGILTRIPHKLFETEWSENGKTFVEVGMYGVGMFFLPADDSERERSEMMIERMIGKTGLEIFGWRTVPTNNRSLSQQAKATQPVIKQVFVLSPYEKPEDIRFERKLYLLRKKIEKALINEGIQKDEAFYLVSFSSRTIIYKGLLLPKQLKAFYLDLRNERYETGMAMVHNRFSTNTFPSWHRAQPNRYLMHNGEINTINGNMNWMNAREPLFQTDMLNMKDISPIVDVDGSDSAMFDNTLEFLVLSGWSLPHAMMMMVPEPWLDNERMDEERKAFYQYHSSLMEPWDGPAALAFTDGKQIGACLDRNGLRPARYILTEDDFLCVSSEVGVVDIPEEKIIRKDRLKPGQMLLADLDKGCLYEDEELKQLIISERPYKDLVEKNIIPIEKVIANDSYDYELKADSSSVLRKQSIFGYTLEELEKVFVPMILNGKEPTGSMGYDAPLALLSRQSQLLFHYFKQKFAQVTNPPIDAIREESITSMEVMLGGNSNLLLSKQQVDKKIRLQTPILTGKDIVKIKNLRSNNWNTATISTLFPVNGNLKESLDQLLQKVENEVNNNFSIIILSDYHVNKENAAIPSLLVVSAVHHHLIRKGLRSKVSLIVESGEPREVHHFAALLGYGANAIHPYLVYKSIPSLIDQENNKVTIEEAFDNYVNAITKGVLKILSKMGISTVQSYIGAQIFEAIGISKEVIDCYFPRTSSKIGGLVLEDISRETCERHNGAFSKESLELDIGSDFHWRREGELHLYQPKTIHTLQQAVRTGSYDLYKKYSAMINDEVGKHTSIRGLLGFKKSSQSIPIDEVEPMESILKRFKTGAMSFGSISKEAHEALAIAMNRIGGMSNSGEGGEDPERFTPLENGDSKCSNIKQVASGRFGVTSHYLIHSKEIQIKMAQGAKPGEGGQLAGHKVTPEVAKTRGVTPGIELISPPPHHDIYSIEDLAQLIYDLKNANSKARINVKLVSSSGVGTIAAGVAKAKADVILISGYDGGTGAASRSSIKHTGMPWELGLAEAQQTLKLNGLRHKVTLETDGKMMSGRDVIIAALLGAEEYGFSTLPLVALGCVMMRVCHLDTCPVGIATQNPELRKNMVGTADQVVNLMRFVAQEIREYMAELGYKSLDQLIGKTDLLKQEEPDHWKTKRIDLSSILAVSSLAKKRNKEEQDHELERNLDSRKLLPLYDKCFNQTQRLDAVLPIENMNRSVGTLVGSKVSEMFGENGLPDDQINYHFKGSAGQSFGAFLPKGITLSLEGDANDYVGKGLSGGKIIISPTAKSTFLAEQNIIIGNATFYGATSGEAFISGIAGERFCVRNSGAQVVVEGIGDHGCEYMTGGRVIILGDVGKNFAAGMSGGISYVLVKVLEAFKKKCNQELVYVERLDEEEDVCFLKNKLKQHVQYTNSKVAKEILENWEYNYPNFVRVIPKKYKAILTEQHKSKQYS